MSEAADSLNSAADAVSDFAADAGTALNTISSGCSGLWDAGISAFQLALDGRNGEAMAVMFGPSLSCYDSVVAALMGLFPFLS
ncbi:hypothetical protein N825_36190 [Skermanella stibiiresistens SB22]|uniref:Uncharacterized protein n=1 Tax=Skermanella stibiiresistens SB22 TaxID=1385369 RepID=W9H2U9_9PROT|nr:hypothetical protein [Skermanella stibiiresistens]EWY40384.1 hypothetical protein N825_36190 [Skermanella stibiiresistens SB22]